MPTMPIARNGWWTVRAWLHMQWIGIFQRAIAMTYRITGLDAAKFSRLFTLSDGGIVEHQAIRRVADAKPDFACRIGLREVGIGEELILLHYEHQPMRSPYQPGHAIYVGRSSAETYDRINEIPESLMLRRVSLRAFNSAHFIVDACLAEPSTLESSLKNLLGKKDVTYIHAHYAKFSCYAARIERV